MDSLWSLKLGEGCKRGAEHIAERGRRAAYEGQADSARRGRNGVILVY